MRYLGGNHRYGPRQGQTLEPNTRLIWLSVRVADDFNFGVYRAKRGWKYSYNFLIRSTQRYLYSVLVLLLFLFHDKFSESILL